MNLYCFQLDRIRKSIDKKVFQVEEKPKTYITTNTTWKSRISKSDLGKVVSYDNIYLLEDDTEKVKEIFSESINAEIDYNKKRVSYIEKDIASLEELRNFLME